MRRLALATLICASASACGDSGDGTGDNPMCMVDTDCGSGQVCARTMECLPPSEVRAIKLSWTVGGAAASATTCAMIPDLIVRLFDDAHNEDDNAWGYLPVQCDAGVFPIDKMPTRYINSELGIDADSGDDT